MTTYIQPLKTSPKKADERKQVEVKHVNSDSYKARQYARYASFRANKLKEEEISKANSVKEKKERPVLSLKPIEHYPSGDNCCLPNVAVFSGVKTKQPSSEFGVTARV
ncbi:hypothetical protein [Proteus sp. NMG38-2]|uniref:hypothetical protein n=1 Tax=Proteus sp. NMG38-2 TaxID=2883107 RepID=UPI001D0BDB27|nr:hypothetical protein [Proteus sp. NMG38-2]UDN34578.1 hypothetical protein LG402_12485 [Proteus sp. NMG38-2]